jgi:hypothetical protein
MTAMSSAIYELLAVSVGLEQLTAEFLQKSLVLPQMPIHIVGTVISYIYFLVHVFYPW